MGDRLWGSTLGVGKSISVYNQTVDKVACLKASITHTQTT